MVKSKFIFNVHIINWKPQTRLTFAKILILMYMKTKIFTRAGASILNTLFCCTAFHTKNQQLQLISSGCYGRNVG